MAVKAFAQENTQNVTEFNVHNKFIEMDAPTRRRRRVIFMMRAYCEDLRSTYCLISLFA